MDVKPDRSYIKFSKDQGGLCVKQSQLYCRAILMSTGELIADMGGTFISIKQLRDAILTVRVVRFVRRW